MVEKQEAVTSQWANVQNAYQRRADLIPNLVNTVKGYATHEQETFTQVTEQDRELLKRILIREPYN